MPIKGPHTITIGMERVTITALAGPAPDNQLKELNIKPGARVTLKIKDGCVGIGAGEEMVYIPFPDQYRVSLSHIEKCNHKFIMRDIGADDINADDQEERQKAPLSSVCEDKNQCKITERYNRK